MDEDTEATGEGDAYWSVSEYVIAGIYAFAVGVNVYLIVDQLTDGELTRSLSMSLAHLRGKVGGWLARERKVRKLYPHVLFDATTIVEEGAKDE